MSTVKDAARWPFKSTTEDIRTADFIHARRTRSDEYTLCEQDGPLLSSDSVTLVLDEVSSGNAPRPVDCPRCLEWMHA